MQERDGFYSVAPNWNATRKWWDAWAIIEREVAEPKPRLVVHQVRNHRAITA